MLIRSILNLLIFLLIFSPAAYSEALHEYLKKTDADYSWKLNKTEDRLQSSLYVLEVVSQKWKGGMWRHELAVVVPKNLKRTDVCYLEVTAKIEDTAFITALAEETGSPAAMVSRIPNQPLFDGKTEDRLLAYTLKHFVDSGDSEWPLLFPMVKSVVKAMDTITVFLKSKDIATNQFALSGSSKRGWTVYLTAATDSRVVGLAPRVFDMLNMKKQTDWAKEVYGEQSEKIINYTELGLIERITEPRTTQLIRWVDPYAYKDKLTAPKLILIGTNDPYWVVDAQRHYYDELPGHKLIYQVPNGDHHISDDAVVRSNLIYWFSKVRGGGKLPVITWSVSDKDKDSFYLQINSDLKLSGANLWQADSDTADFRDAKWTQSRANAEDFKVNIKAALPSKGFRAYLGEVIIEDKGHRAVFSTTAFVRKAAGSSP